MSGSMSGRWRRGMVQLMGHRQTKGPVTVRQHLNYRATSRLHSFHLKCSKQKIISQGRAESRAASARQGVGRWQAGARSRAQTL